MKTAMLLITLAAGSIASVFGLDLEELSSEPATIEATAMWLPQFFWPARFSPILMVKTASTAEPIGNFFPRPEILQIQNW